MRIVCPPASALRASARPALTLCLTVLLLAFGSHASAQTYESVGSRAQGMAGAFVAVADDATATWWNPAGLATGALFSAVVERGQLTANPVPNSTPNPDLPSTRSNELGFAVAFPALGLSYYRLRVSEIASLPTTDEAGAGRQDTGVLAPVATRSVSINQFGATVGQSIGAHLVIASTVKLMRAGEVNAVVVDSDPLGAAEELSIDSDMHLGLDIGAMVSAGYFRLGVSMKNLSEPDFGEGANVFTLKRQARAGIALLSGKHGILDGVTFAADSDLTRTTTIFGDVRHLATGGEVVLFNRHLAVRGGGSLSTVGERRESLSFGGSVAPLTGVYIDVSKTTGRDETVDGWTTAVRLTF